MEHCGEERMSWQKDLCGQTWLFSQYEKEGRSASQEDLLKQELQKELKELGWMHSQATQTVIIPLDVRGGQLVMIFPSITADLLKVD